MSDLLDLTGRAATTHFWFRGFGQFVRPAIHQVAAGRRQLRMLDCGCGTGHNLALLAPYGRAFGVDLLSQGLASARTNGASPLSRGDVTRLPFISNAFDIVTSFDVMQCVLQDAMAMNEMARVAKPGGSVIVTMAALEALRGDHSEVWQEHRRYTPARARALVEGAGLHVERITYLFGTLLPLMYAARLIQRWTRPFREVSRDSDIRIPVAPINAALTWLVSTEARLSPVVSMPLGSSLLIIARKPQ